jgi:cardiolipin synthase A/B
MQDKTRKRRRRDAAYTEHNSVRIIRGGAAYFNSIEDIAAGATYSLHMQTYIFDEDETGRAVAAALMKAARRGVLVYLMVDAYASQRLSSEFIETIKASGAHFRFFESLFKSKAYYFGRRMHHKIVVADARVCLVGGMNVSNRYNDMPGQSAWLDWALLVEGDIAEVINKVCVRMWNRAVFAPRCLATAHPPVAQIAGKCLVRVSRNDWVYKRTGITRSYKELFAAASSEVIIMTSYFWPPQGLLRKMEAAARRGVKVTIVLTGKADVPLAKYAERYLYTRLFRSGISVYEYRRNVLHGKVAIRDKEWMTVGSYNLNNISAFASVELNLDVWDEAVASKMREAVMQVVADDSRRITQEGFYASSNLFKRLFYYVAYRSIQALFFLFTFYFVQRDKRS